MRLLVLSSRRVNMHLFVKGHRKRRCQRHEIMLQSFEHFRVNVVFWGSHTPDGRHFLPLQHSVCLQKLMRECLIRLRAIKTWPRRRQDVMVHSETKRATRDLSGVLICCRCQRYGRCDGGKDRESHPCRSNLSIIEEYVFLPTSADVLLLSKNLCTMIANCSSAIIIKRSKWAEAPSDVIVIIIKWTHSCGGLSSTHSQRDHEKGERELLKEQKWIIVERCEIIFHARAKLCTRDGAEMEEPFCFFCLTLPRKIFQCRILFLTQLRSGISMCTGCVRVQSVTHLFLYKIAFLMALTCSLIILWFNFFYSRSIYSCWTSSEVVAGDEKALHQFK